jgi:hypothetical protein
MIARASAWVLKARIVGRKPIFKHIMNKLPKAKEIEYQDPRSSREVIREEK